MFTHYVTTIARTITLIVLVILLVGCGSDATTTPLPPANTPTSEAPPPTVEPSPVIEASVAGDSWIRVYRADQDNVCDDVLMADDGGYYLVGTTNLEFEPERRGDTYLIRTDAAGQVLWVKAYGGDGYEGGMAIVQTSEGLLLSGATNSADSEGMDILLTMVDRDGNQLWTKTFGGPLDEMGVALPLDDGGYVLGGNVVDPDDFVVDPGTAGYGGFEGRSNIYLARIDADDNEVWSRAFGGENNVLATAGLLSSDGGVLALGTILYFPDSGDDIYLVKVDENGDEVWSRTWEEGSMNAHDLIQTSDGNYLISGAYAPLDDSGETKPDYLFIKVDPEGNEIWRSTFGDPEMIDRALALAETMDGGYVTMGDKSRGYHSGDDVGIALVKIDANGQFLWEEVIETSAHSMLSTILQHPDGGYVVAGSIMGTYSFNPLLIKTDSEGYVSE
jgi:hypothetical protein